MDKAAKVLHWRAERDLAAMCRDDAGTGRLGIRMGMRCRL